METITAAQYREMIATPAAHAQAWRKYRNVPTKLDDIRFDSKREAERWADLVLLQRGGTIEKLERQVTFDLIVNGVKVGKVRPDFTYIEGDTVVAEDSKGHQTEAHKLRWRLAQALYPLIEWRLS